jgi:hypothetical protein
VRLAIKALPRNAVGAVFDRDFGSLRYTLLRWNAKSASETPPTIDSSGKVL